jgi:hypothetical protein
MKARGRGPFAILLAPFGPLAGAPRRSSASAESHSINAAKNCPQKDGTRTVGSSRISPRITHQCVTKQNWRGFLAPGCARCPRERCRKSRRNCTLARLNLYVLYSGPPRHHPKPCVQPPATTNCASSVDPNACEGAVCWLRAMGLSKARAWSG